MQRIVFISALLIAAAFGAGVQGNCPTYACLKTGDNCGAPCGNCLTDLQACVTANIANATGVCACLNNALTCITPRPDATICQISLKAYSNAYPGNNCTTLAGATCAACPTIAAYPNPPAIPTVTVCNPNTDYCSGTTTKTCAPKIPAGGACNNVAGECVPFYTCKAGTCQRAGLSYANDYCVNSTDCFGGKMNCTAGVCVGLPNGTACTSTYECAYGHYCNNFAGVCLPYVQNGAACTKGPIEVCGVTGTCGFAGTCVNPYTAVAGAQCTISSYPPECTFGTYCNIVAGVNGNCTAAPQTPVCYNDTDCTVTGAGSTCTCGVGRTDGKGQCSSTVINTANLGQCITQAAAVATCLATNMCRQNPAGDSMTCAGTKCKNELLAYNNCISPNVYATLCAIPTSAATGGNSAAGSNSVSGTKPNSAATLSVGAVLALSAAAML